jgi:tight adherence protein C
MTFPLVLLAGVLVAAGLLSLAAALVPTTPRLEDAMGRVAGEPQREEAAHLDVGPATTRSERLGALLYQHSPIPLSSRQQQQLRLQDKSVAEFFSDKAVFAVVGAVIPAVLTGTWGWISGELTVLPAVAALLGAVVGFFVPDLTLQRGTRAARSSAVEALLVYLDLVTLERLANASATQALHNAAKLSEATIFTQIRGALERAQLEQQSPYAELRRLAEHLNLPELTDVADVMQLDETGAALSGALRARVRELRDAHLTQEQMQASATAEGMTFYMTLPALIFGLIFMVPPLMRIVLG